ncbi:MAG: calcium-binding protein, partial [Rhodospirillaceae bacterium]
DNSGDNEGTNEATPEGEGEGEEEATPAEAGDGTPAEEAAPDEGAAEEALPQDGTEDLVPAETIQSDAVPDPIASNPFETFFANAFPPPPAAERQVLEILGIDPDAEDDVVVDLEDAIDEVIERIEENEERIEENRDITEERLEEPEEVEAVEGPASSPNQANNPNVEATEQQESGFQDGDFPFSEGDDVFLASDEDNTYFFNQAYGGNDFVQDLGGEDTFAFLNLSSVAVWLARTEQGYEVRFFTEGLGTGTFDTNVISAAAGFEQSFLEVLGLIEILRATTQDSFAGDNTALLTALDFAEESFAFLLAGTDAENTFVLNTDNAQGYAVFGLAGDDIIEVIEGGGAHIVGGDGTDRVDYSALSGSWRLQISYDAGLGAFQVMRQLLSGGQVIEEFNDDLFEIEGISASAGNDQIDITNGGALNSVRGLAGDDQIRVRDGGFVAEVLGNAGSDTLTIEGAFATSVEGGADSDVINILNASVDTVDGGNAGDTITVDAGTASTVTGGDGADTITVNNGSVTNLSGGAGSDSITIENSTVNNVAGGNGSDSITIVNAFVETVEGGSGNDTISVNAGNNNALTLFGGAGNDVFDIGSSAATGNIFGGDGSDKVFLRAGSIVNGTIDLDETLGDQDTLVLLNPSQTTIAGGINGVELVYYYGTTGMDDLSVNSPGIAGVTDITTRFALLPNGGSDDIDLGTTDTKFFEVVF